MGLVLVGLDTSLTIMSYLQDNATHLFLQPQKHPAGVPAQALPQNSQAEPHLLQEQ